MCGRYTVAKDHDALSRYFGAEFSDTHRPIYNASPGQRLPVILNGAPSTIQPAHWGITSAVPDRRQRLLVNARSETVDRLPMFRDAFRRRRCLVLADGFYEWQTTAVGRQPYRMVLSTDEPCAFAGIWWARRDTPAYVILTQEADTIMRPIHNRMPVILARDQLAPWLDRGRRLRDVVTLLTPQSESPLQAYFVSGAVNHAGHEDRRLIDPVPMASDRTGLPFD